MRAKDTLGLSQILSHAKHEMRLKMGKALEGLGLSAAQYSVLSILEEQPDLTNAELARASYVTPQTMIRIMQDLKKRGFVSSCEHAEHGLKIQFQLTKKATDALCKGHEKIDALERRMIKGLSAAEAKALLSSLELCFKNLKS